ncbi:MAG: CoA-transferase, partial [Proteobacteria bacterium]|nr:CoA-transferase [Pseudomonadota bacterium]
SRAEQCAVAVAEAFRGDREVLASPFGTVPMLGIRLAKLTFEPDLLMTDGIASRLANVPPVGVADAPEPVVEGWVPFRTIFDLLWSGRRHVMMGATQIDRFGNQNFACIGDYAKPKAQLLGMRGAPGNTISHKTSYWVPNHSPKVFVEKVDVVSGVGYDRAAALGQRSSRFHCIHQVVTNLAVLDFTDPDHAMRLRSVHAGVSVDDVVAATGFELVRDEAVPETRPPSEEELRILREVLDPNGLAAKEVPN